MTKEEKYEACKDYFDMLSEALSETHELMPSCNKDLSDYLVPKGTSWQVTYYTKPEMSFRISDHWNWRANLNKCTDEYYIQRLSVDMPHARKRNVPGMASKPRYGMQVAVFGSDHKYHAVFGEVYDRKTHMWSWRETSIADVVEMIRR